MDTLFFEQMYWHMVLVQQTQEFMKTTQGEVAVFWSSENH